MSLTLAQAEQFLMFVGTYTKEGGKSKHLRLSLDAATGQASRSAFP